MSSLRRWLGVIFQLIMRTRADGCTGLASMLAYNFFLALPAVLIFLVAALSYLPIADLGGRVAEQFHTVLPSDTLTIVERTVERTLERGGGSLLVFGFLAALYIMNNGYAGLISSLNRIYGLEEKRPWLMVRLRALVMSIFAAGAILAAFALILLAPALVDILYGDKERPELLPDLLGWLRWPAIVILALLGIESTYKYSACGGPRWRFISPGTPFAAVFWLLATLTFGYYVDRYGSYDRIYGSLGAVIALLTWMWISALMFLVGAEINAAWHRRGPEG